MTIRFTLLTLASISLLPLASDAGEAVATRWTPPAIASDQYEATPTFTPDGREMYFMLSDPRFERYQLRRSRCAGGAWTRPEPLPFAASGAFDADPFVTPDGKRLYFISTRHSSGREDFDIYYADRKANHAWSEPRRLPEPVNSSGAELLPRADATGKLYFGSDRKGGHGQSDIYVAVADDDGTWRVTNVGPPVSTSANEYEADISRDGRTLIAVIDRGDRSHLYHFTLSGNGWTEQGRIPAFTNVFQVGPLLSPTGDRLLFAQADGERSGEMFLIDLKPRADERWPPRCPGT